MKDAAAPAPPLDPLALLPAAPQLGAVQMYDVDLELSTPLPRDHPGWQRDVLSVSARARALLAQLRPVAVRVLTFWDHAVRTVGIGGRKLEVDLSGCYRFR